MSSGRDGTSGDNPGDGGESGNLPPKAPAYDFRTGQPLEKPQEPYGSDPGSGSGDDELGIWAPGGQGEADKGGGYDSGYDSTYDYGATSAPGASGGYTHPPTGPTYEGRPGSYERPQYGQAGYSQPSHTAPGVPTEVPSRGGYGQPPYPGYGAPGATPTLTGPGRGPGPDRPGRGLAVLGGVVGVLVVAVAVLLTVLLVGGSDDSDPVASTGSAAPGTSTAPSGGAGKPSGSSNGGTGGTGSSGGTSGSNAARATFVSSVDDILSESASGRSQVAGAVNGVNNGCSVSPASAASTMQSVIDNRESVLAQANALDAPDAATSTAKANLVRSLELSIEANRSYLQWFEDLQAEYPDEAPPGCPGGAAPQNVTYDEATAASGQATAAKQAFVASYNPLASSAGQRTWSESEF